MFTLKESEPGKPLLLHDEPIYIDDKIIGRSTSGNYSFNFNKNLSFGYVSLTGINDFSIFLFTSLAQNGIKSVFSVFIVKKVLSFKTYCLSTNRIMTFNNTIN